MPSIPSSRKTAVRLALAALLAWCVGGAVPAHALDPVGPAIRRLSLPDCLSIALENNRTRPVSRLNVEIAEAQLKQALSSYWPQAGVKSSVTRMDEDPNFIYPGISIPLPGYTVQIPDQKLKMMDRDTWATSADLVYPLYTGGLRPALVKQARSGVAAARQEVRRTDLQVVYDVKRFYYGAVLAKRLRGIASDSLERMEVTLDLTEMLYKGGSTKVKKTDYLRNKTAVEALRSAFALAKGMERLAVAALTNAIGMEWDAEIDVSDMGIPFRPQGEDLGKFVSGAYSFNPDWKKMEEAINAAEAQVDEKKSGHLPRLAMVGRLSHIGNSYEKGLASPENKDSWMGGIAMELPLFNGFRTRNEVKEAGARLEKMRLQKILLGEGIALQVKDAFLRMERSREQRQAMSEAARTAEENRDLNERAYRDEFVETKDVIEAQLVESYMKAGSEMVLYDHAEAQARLEYVVGSGIEGMLR
ncbi:MAG: TolC family protein [Deltaproteobacteria bacterium]|nr:TolC family protein [Deltaproteobacteria bacterium]